MRSVVVLSLCAALLTGALAQEAEEMPQSFPANLEIRLGIVESRIGRLETDVSRLSAVPTQLARIEEKITALSERSSGTSDILQSLGVGTVMAVITSVIGYQMGKKSK